MLLSGNIEPYLEYNMRRANIGNIKANYNAANQCQSGYKKM